MFLACIRHRQLESDSISDLLLCLDRVVSNFVQSWRWSEHIDWNVNCLTTRSFQNSHYSKRDFHVLCTITQLSRSPAALLHTAFITIEETLLENFKIIPPVSVWGILYIHKDADQLNKTFLHQHLLPPHKVLIPTLLTKSRTCLSVLRTAIHPGASEDR